VEGVHIGKELLREEDSHVEDSAVGIEDIDSAANAGSPRLTRKKGLVEEGA
jgi:hypothetical protein